jgi:hypothetical protein
MSRLRKRAGTRLREPFGKAGLTVAIIALVMALVGGAYAAGGLTKSQEKQVTKIAKKYAGKPGAPGGAGANGKDGTNGTNGKDGTAGAAGQDGTDGKSVAVSAYSGEECEEAEGEEGAEFTDGTDIAYACNGQPGTEGSPWTLGGTLPPSATETGVYGGPTASANLGIEQALDNGKQTSFPVSFTVPVSPVPTFAYVPGVAGGFGSDPAAGCPGVTAAGIPQAGSGKFCVYGFASDAVGLLVPSATVTTRSPDTAIEEHGVKPAGTILNVACENSDPNGALSCYAKGLWAVTG